MIKKMGYDWRLRQLMAGRGMFQTSDLAAPLAERGITLSREQLWRLVSQPPERLSLDVLAAMCDILGCGPGDLIKVRVENTSVRKNRHRPGRRRSGTATRHGPATTSVRVTTRRSAVRPLHTSGYVSACCEKSRPSRPNGRLSLG